MANLEVNAASSVCRKCGLAYGRLKGYFPICYAYLYKGVGYLPYCSECCKKMFDTYYAECGDEKKAMHQFCRKLDLYWSDDVYEKSAGKTGTRTLLQNYIARLNNAVYSGKSYDDTLREEERMWVTESPAVPQKEEEKKPEATDDDIIISAEPIELTEDIIAFWGPGYTPEMYRELEQRLRYYMSQMDGDVQMDIGAETLLRQIVMMEIDINKARVAGLPVDKLVNSLNSLLSNLKKPQKKDTADSVSGNTPFGVWIKRWEDERPIPEPDEELKDVDGIVRYVTVWFFGHLCKMLGIRNSYCKMYEDEIAKLRVERPEYDDEDDDAMLSDLFGESESESGGIEELIRHTRESGGEPDERDE